MRLVRFFPVAVALISAACTQATDGNTAPVTLPENSPTSTLAAPITTEPPTSVTTLDVVTSFAPTTDCDPTSGDADTQVVRAFITAYNDRDAARLSELTDVDEIWDIGGVPHLGVVTWSDVTAWAERGWAVNDRLELVSVQPYGPNAGSDIKVRRTNDVLAANGIDQLVLLIKVQSSGCTIGRLVASVETGEPDAASCAFFTTYIDELHALDIEVEVPQTCTD